MFVESKNNDVNGINGYIDMDDNENPSSLPLHESDYEEIGVYLQDDSTSTTDTGSTTIFNNYSHEQEEEQSLQPKQLQFTLVNNNVSQNLVQYSAFPQASEATLSSPLAPQECYDYFQALTPLSPSANHTFHGYQTPPSTPLPPPPPPSPFSPPLSSPLSPGLNFDFHGKVSLRGEDIKDTWEQKVNKRQEEEEDLARNNDNSPATPLVFETPSPQLQDKVSYYPIESGEPFQKQILLHRDIPFMRGNQMVLPPLPLSPSSSSSSSSSSPLLIMPVGLGSNNDDDDDATMVGNYSGSSMQVMNQLTNYSVNVPLPLNTPLLVPHESCNILQTPLPLPSPSPAAAASNNFNFNVQQFNLIEQMACSPSPMQIESDDDDADADNVADGAKVSSNYNVSPSSASPITPVSNFQLQDKNTLAFDVPHHSFQGMASCAFGIPQPLVYSFIHGNYMFVMCGKQIVSMTCISPQQVPASAPQVPPLIMKNVNESVSASDKQVENQEQVSKKKKKKKNAAAAAAASNYQETKITKESKKQKKKKKKTSQVSNKKKVNDKNKNQCHSNVMFPIADVYLAKYVIKVGQHTLKPLTAKVHSTATVKYYDIYANNQHVKSLTLKFNGLCLPATLTKNPVKLTLVGKLDEGPGYRLLVEKYNGSQEVFDFEITYKHEN